MSNDAYVTVDEVLNSSLGDFVDENTLKKFSEFTQDKQEKLLRNASSYIDMAYPNVMGVKENASQTLLFPRKLENNSSFTGDAWDAPIPTGVKKATVMALSLMVNGADLFGVAEQSAVQYSFGPGMSPSMESIKKMKVGPIEMELKDDFIPQNKYSLSEPPEPIGVMMAPFVACRSIVPGSMQSFNVFGF